MPAETAPEGLTGRYAHFQQSAQPLGQIQRRPSEHRAPPRSERRGPHRRPCARLPARRAAAWRLDRRPDQRPHRHRAPDARPAAPQRPMGGRGRRRGDRGRCRADGVVAAAAPALSSGCVRSASAARSARMRASVSVSSSPTCSASTRTAVQWARSRMVVISCSVISHSQVVHHPPPPLSWRVGRPDRQPRRAVR